jgi:hypothetical protein
MVLMRRSDGCIVCQAYASLLEERVSLLNHKYIVDAVITTLIESTCELLVLDTHSVIYSKILIIVLRLVCRI